MVGEGAALATGAGVVGAHGVLSPTTGGASATDPLTRGRGKLY